MYAKNAHLEKVENVLLKVKWRCIMKKIILILIVLMFLIGCGKQGEMGPQGSTGSTGTNGTNGVNGSDGTTGPQGPIGQQGPGTRIFYTGTFTYAAMPQTVSVNYLLSNPGLIMILVYDTGHWYIANSGWYVEDNIIYFENAWFQGKQYKIVIVV